MSPDHFNPPSMLPPVGCPLLLLIGTGAVVKAERVTYLTDRDGMMDYRLADGSVITGRFWWTY